MDRMESTFRIVHAALDGLNWWLTDGSALGAVRGGRVAGEDIDLGVWVEDLPAVAAALARHRPTVRESEIDVRLQAKVDIHGHHRTGDLVWYPLGPERKPTYAFSAALFAELEQVQLYGLSVWAPCPVEDYLTAHYGPHWRKPRGHWDYRNDPPCARPDMPGGRR